MPLIRRARILLLLAIGAAACAPASSPRGPSPAATPLAQPPAPKRHGSLQIEIVGKGPSIVLLPGLGCPARVFDPLLPSLAARFRLHLVNLPGFASNRATEGLPLGTARTDLVDYLQSLSEGPVIVLGHSVGGFLGFWVASQRPDLVRQLVVIDGVPYLPALFFPLATPQGMAPMATQTRDQFAAMSPVQLRAALEGTLTQMIRDPTKRQSVLQQSAQSSAAALGAAQYEVSTTDLRQEVARITAPVLLLVGTRDVPPSVDRQSLAWAYSVQVAKIPRHQIAWLPDAGHFAFLDQPDQVLNKIASFLNDPKSQP